MQLSLLTEDSVTSELLNENFRQFLSAARQDAAANAMLASVAEKQLEIRRMFAQQEYESLLKTFQKGSPFQLPTETILILTLSAAQTRDLAGFDKWAMELQRRLDDPELKTWLQQIRKEVT